jgi:hypothetical protein
MERVPLTEALRHRDAVLRVFMDGEGRLTSIPVKHAKRLVVLDHLAQLFEPGVRYPEVEVNRRLRAAHYDVAALRRYLVEDGFLDRDVEAYWRIGGTVPDDAIEPLAPAEPPDLAHLDDDDEDLPER